MKRACLCVLLLASCSAPSTDQCVIERRGVSREVVRVSGDCGQQDFTGVDLSRADVSGVSWGAAICPDGAAAEAVGGSCEGHLSPREGGEPDLEPGDDLGDLPEAPSDLAEAPDEGAADLTDLDEGAPELPDLVGEDTPTSPEDVEDLGDEPDADPDDLPDPCASLGCPPEATCDPEAPACVCPQGSQLRGDACVPASACEAPCHPLARCEETQAGPRCVCGAGTEGNGGYCVAQSACAALRFNGISNFVDAFYGAPRLEPPFTIELWLRPETLGTYGTVVYYGDPFALTPRYFRLRLNDSGGLEVELMTDASGSFVVASLPNSGLGWFHVAVQVPGFSVWLNGIQQDVVLQGDGRWDSDLADSELIFGASAQGFSLEDQYTGLMRELRVSSGGRGVGDFSVPQRHELDENTLMLWRMNEGQGNDVHDVGPSGHHGRQVGLSGWRACSEQ